MHLADLIDAETLVALEPDELGLVMLRALVARPQHQALDVGGFIAVTIRGYASNHGGISEAIREAWAWLEGQALLIHDDRFLTGETRVLSRRARRLGKERDPRQSFSARLLHKE